MKIEDFEQALPAFRPEIFLVGRFEGWGLLEGPLGGLHGRFTVQAEGTPGPSPDAVRLREVWSFDNGHQDTLDWTIRRAGEGRYVGAEPRLDGEAEGEQAGCAFRWRYRRDTPQPGGGSVKLHFEDWFFRVGEDGLAVRGSASKLGAPFASAHVVYHKLAN